eukprot:TRINITY_DN1786_c0_g1_i1.p1 TRINITY_DN1786_c0_g1~~TRINITY_DN1786_c0_g1_i1.p1  ORF type:complete len:260 (-),score=48.43 TRINITY_DN1786_c0_g1_i1:25-747(-)
MKTSNTLITCLTLTLILQVAQSFSIDRVRLIDTHGKNVIFRGNEPVSSKTFLYQNLTDAIRQVAHESNITSLTGDFYLIDYSLLLLERSDINTEKAFWDKNGDKGMYVSHPTVGSVLNPDWFGKDIIKFMVEDIGSFDRLPSAMKHLKGYLEMEKDVPVVVYVHCEAGKDRTGEMSGSYYMKYLGWSFNQALYYDNRCVEGNRDIQFASRNALQWYCYYLKYVEHMKMECEIDHDFVGHC